MRTSSLVLLGLLSLWLVAAERARAQVGSIIQVDTAADTVAADGLCSLREALLASNGNSIADGSAASCRGTGIDSIRFALGSGTPVIQIGSPLPAITDQVSIRGNTGGATRVELRGPGPSGSIFQGLHVLASATSLRNLVIGGFRGDGVTILGANVSVVGCFIGTDATGALARPNGRFGISVSGTGVRIGGALGTTPGGPCTGDCNLISGNTAGGVQMRQVYSPVIQGNFIGLDASGTLAVPNGEFGVYLEPADGDLVGALVGGSSPHERNVISGNFVGVHIRGASPAFAYTARVQGNFIGTDAAGGAAVPNMRGISTQGLNSQFAQPNEIRIGGSGPGEGNLISGNALSGVDISSSRGILVRGNSIGGDASGQALSNGGHGVMIRDPVLDVTRGNRIGGTSPGEGNAIAFNVGFGVQIHAVDPPLIHDNPVRGNSIHGNGFGGIGYLRPERAGPAPPVVLQADAGVSGTSSCPGCAVDVYSDSAGQGRIYHGSTTADAAGSWQLDFAAPGPNVTATVTDGGDTSVFSAPRACSDMDRDGICDAVDDSDGDGLVDRIDRCPFWPSSQRDTDGDGRGDECECTDQNGDGRNTVSDLVAINQAIFNPALVTPLCDGNNDGRCNVSDIVAANVEIFSPISTSTCARQPIPGP